MGLLEDQPDKGTIEVMGQRIDGMDAEDIVNLGIAMVTEGRGLEGRSFVFHFSTPKHFGPFLVILLRKSFSRLRDYGNFFKEVEP